MKFLSKVSVLLHKIPGKRYFGIYRFLPLFFLTGATLEYVMINWHVGEVNFYRTYKKRQVEKATKTESPSPIEGVN